jgi:hypothetical protein
MDHNNVGSIKDTRPRLFVKGRIQRARPIAHLRNLPLVTRPDGLCPERFFGSIRSSVIPRFELEIQAVYHGPGNQHFASAHPVGAPFLLVLL